MDQPSERMKFWRQAVAQQERQGRSVREFCRERRLNEHSFYAWRKRVRSQPSVTFALVETNRPPALIEVSLLTGERLRIPCEVAALRLVLGVLKESHG